MRRLLVLAFTIILSLYYFESDDEKEKKYIDLSRFIVEADGKKKDFYTFHKDIDKVLNAEKIEVEYEDVLRVKDNDNHCHIRVIRSNRGIRSGKKS